jgi:sphingomyelin phosphodiesterase
MLRWLLLTLTALFLASTTRADTHVYVHNNTPFAYDARIETNLGGQYWKRGDNFIAPGRQRIRTMQTNRDSGIKSGNYYEFRIVLTPRDGGGPPVGLKVRLKGTTFFSDMWQSVDGDPWFSDRNTHNRSFGNINVKYRAYFTGGADDIEFILQYRYPVCDSGDPNTLHVLSYNTYMRPTTLFINGQAARTPLLAEWLRNSRYDVILFNEMFDDAIRNQTINLLRSEYPHFSRIVGTDRGIEQDGGVFFMSRWPIVAQDQRLYGRISGGSDSMADKGVGYVCIDKQGKKYHLFGSHTQSTRSPGDYPADANWRRQQFGIIRQFIDSKNIPSSEPVIVGGDLNVDRNNNGEYASMLSLLDVKAPVYTGHGATWDPSINLCADAGRPEYLDYLLIDKRHLGAIEATNEARIARSSEEWKALATDRARWDLSDHFPVYGRFRFPANPLLIKKLPEGIKLNNLEKFKVLKPDGGG